MKLQAVLPRSFFSGSAVDVARALLGCVLVHESPEGRTSGIIVETEAYEQTDAASHSFRGPTPRNQVMFGPGGYTYVYRSYGLHWCVNVTVGPEGFGAAVLLRALEPLEGIEIMAARRRQVPLIRLARGPGCLTEALGINARHNGADLLRGDLRLHRAPTDRAQPSIGVSPRIGITKAVEEPWRFFVSGNRFVSGKRQLSP